MSARRDADGLINRRRAAARSLSGGRRRRPAEWRAGRTRSWTAWRWLPWSRPATIAVETFDEPPTAVPRVSPLCTAWWSNYPPAVGCSSGRALTPMPTRTTHIRSRLRGLSRLSAEWRL